MTNEESDWADGEKYEEFKPTPDKTIICAHTEFFLDSCTSERFETYYAQHHSPFLEVLALHR